MIVGLKVVFNEISVGCLHDICTGRGKETSLHRNLHVVLDDTFIGQYSPTQARLVEMSYNVLYRSPRQDQVDL